MAEVGVVDRAAVVRTGKRLEYFTIGWNTLEALVAVGAGLAAGSISLVGFGIDSVIEVTSGAALLWRMSVDADVHRRERSEKRAARIVGICFLFLAAYVSYESVTDLLDKHTAERSVPGIVLACLSVVIMPLLSRRKRQIGRRLGSGAMHADAKQTEFCAYLSGILLAGLLLNALWGLWWADAAAALVMVPIMVKEGIEGLRGETCADCKFPESA